MAKFFQDHMWQDSIFAIKLSCEISDFETFYSQLIEKLPQTSAETRRRSASTIVQRFFPKKTLNQPTRQTWRIYKDENLLQHLMRYQFLVNESVIADFAKQQVLIREPGECLEFGKLADSFLEQTYGEVKPKLRDRLSGALQATGLVTRTKGIMYVRELSDLERAFGVLLHVLFEPLSLEKGGKVAIHIVPRVSFNLGFQINITDYKNKLPLPIHSYSFWETYNFDGILKYSFLPSDGKVERSYSYIQLFRNGIFELVYMFNNIQNERNGIPENRINYEYENLVYKSLDECIKLSKNADITLPYFIFISLINVQGYQVYHPNLCFSSRGLNNCKIDRNILSLPELLIDDTSLNLIEILRPTFDTVWQASGQGKRKKKNDIMC